MAQGTRILVFLHSFEPGGVERVALRLCDAWRTAGADLTVLLGRKDGAMRGHAPELDYVTYSSGPISTARFETLWMILCLWRRVRAERPDVIFCAGNSYTVVAVALRLLLGRSCPPLVAKISNALDRPDMSAPARAAYRLWLRIQGRCIDRFVAMSEALRAEIVDALRVPEERTAVIDNPALSQAQVKMLSRPSERGREPGRTFLAAGRLAPQKRFDLLIRAFAAGSRPEDRLVILGEGPNRRSLEALVRRLGLGDRVSLPGHASAPETWFRRCNAFLLSSDYEGLPGVVVEALAAGIDIVATDCSPGMAELLGQGRWGRLVPLGDREAFAHAIAEAGDRSPDPEGAREQAMRFTVERAAPDYLRLMRTMKPQFQ